MSQPPGAFLRYSCGAQPGPQSSWPVPPAVFSLAAVDARRRAGAGTKRATRATLRTLATIAS